MYFRDGVMARDKKSCEYICQNTQVYTTGKVSRSYSFTEVSRIHTNSCSDDTVGKGGSGSESGNKKAFEGKYHLWAPYPTDNFETNINTCVINLTGISHGTEHSDCNIIPVLSLVSAAESFPQDHLFALP